MKCRAALQSRLRELWRGLYTPRAPEDSACLETTVWPDIDEKCKLGTRDIKRPLLPGGQASGQETFNVILDPADGGRVDVYGCQEYYRQQMYKYLPTGSIQA